MPRTRIIYFMERDGVIPFLAWWHDLPHGARDKVRVRIQRLRELGYELRRPEADFLRDGIYELRCKDRKIQFRILYFFHGQGVAILGHSLVKAGDKVPAADIDLAIRRRDRFKKNPQGHTAP